VIPYRYNKYITLPDLSVFPNPSGHHIMVILKAYMDNSGEEDDPQHKVCSLAGYITTAKKWRKFDKLWKQTLIMYKVPYLHMKEFAPNIGPFEKFKDHEKDRRQFIQSLVDIMEETHLRGIMSVIRLGDFRKFIKDKGLNIDAYSFNLYACMSIIAATWQNKPIEIIIDRINKPGRMIDKAMEYIETDVYWVGRTNYIQLSPLPKGITFREIVPIQAADFLAWEIRKLIDSREEWYNKFKIGDDPKAWNESMIDWSKQRGINTRKSYAILSKQTIPYGFVWDYKELCSLHYARNQIWP
jgi:hypothetical protein